jgi:hypothetical protein
MILGSGLMSRSPGPAEFGPGCPLPTGGAAGRPRAHWPSVSRDWLHASVSPPHVSSQTGSQAVSVHTLRAIRVGAGQYPRWRTGPQFPTMARRSDRPPGPCSQRVSEAALMGVLFALAPVLSGIRVAPGQVW